MLQTLFGISVSIALLLSGLLMVCFTIIRVLRSYRGLGPSDSWGELMSILFYSALGMIVAVSGAYGLQCVSRGVPLSGVSLVVLAFGIVGVFAMIASEVRRSRHLRALNKD